MKMDISMEQLQSWIHFVTDSQCNLEILLGEWTFDLNYKPDGGLECRDENQDIDESGYGYALLAIDESQTLEGHLEKFKFQGACIERIWGEGWKQCMYKDGVKNGYSRTFSLNNTFQSLNVFSYGKSLGPAMIQRSGNAFLFGPINANGELHGEGAYLYPGMKYGIWGTFTHGKLKLGQFGPVLGALAQGRSVIQPVIEVHGFTTNIIHDPSTSLRISRTPEESDGFEDLHLMVKPSGIPGAGEGLFARVTFQPGDLVALFNGLKIFKVNRVTRISAASEDWSDYRLTLNKEVDLDITDDYVALNSYRATLGHKACHSFEAKNARFDNLYHPRFGEIMSIVATEVIQADTEILVNYNYNLELAPQWYQDLWETRNLLP